jgi:hypothetical protein
VIGRLLFCRYGAHLRSDRLEQHLVSDRYKTVTNIMPTATAPDALSTAFSLMTVDHIRAALKILGTGQVRLMAERGSAWYSNPDRPLSNLSRLRVLTWAAAKYAGAFSSPHLPAAKRLPIRLKRTALWHPVTNIPRRSRTDSHHDRARSAR